ncbi:hypothetical protein PGT21_027809 [Puccinia graminis f. sp. tritici]|uniref:Uncharacterized protein n=1 Tax=Puccinia graminis f. sp. tritici TaxID=56615 RepID=A0A5B0S5A2_PUCGR|nr:hypothetical protein PGT21_027809 [Puccinia graminis f. sp. tritici]KAA1132978.1 hypothetical protein PGTUg99_016731 [Puccinia graminis f. sp. tritici]
MLFTSIVFAFYLLKYQGLSAHPTLYTKSLVKRGIDQEATIGTQIHLLHKRMEGSYKEAKIKESRIGCLHKMLESCPKKGEKKETNEVGEELNKNSHNVYSSSDKDKIVHEKSYEGSSSTK